MNRRPTSPDGKANDIPAHSLCGLGGALRVYCGLFPPLLWRPIGLRPSAPGSSLRPSCHFVLGRPFPPFDGEHSYCGAVRSNGGSTEGLHSDCFAAPYYRAACRTKSPERAASLSRHSHRICSFCDGGGGAGLVEEKPSAIRPLCQPATPSCGGNRPFPFGAVAFSVELGVHDIRLPNPVIYARKKGPA